MCIAIYKPKATAPDWEAYENGMDGNPDGWGFTAVVNGELRTQVGLGKFAQFRKAFEPYATGNQAMVHFRFATHGLVNQANCHPFHITPGLAVIHNGVIGIESNVNKSMSDTWHFTELCFKPIAERHPDFFLCPAIKFLGEQATSGSKFVFLRADGEHSIWGSGTRAQDGHWYSNTGYKVAKLGFGYHTEKYSNAAWWTERTPAPEKIHKASELIADPYSGRSDATAEDDDERQAYLDGFSSLAAHEGQEEYDYDPSDLVSAPSEGNDATYDLCDEEEPDAGGVQYREVLAAAGLNDETLGSVFDAFGVDGLEALAELAS